MENSKEFDEIELEITNTDRMAWGNLFEIEPFEDGSPIFIYIVFFFPNISTCCFFRGFGAFLAAQLDSPCFSASVAPFSTPKDALGGKPLVSQTPVSQNSTTSKQKTCCS